MQALISLALLLPRPQGRTIDSISATSAFARASTVGNFAYRSCTTTFYSLHLYIVQPDAHLPVISMHYHNPECSPHPDTSHF